MFYYSSGCQKHHMWIINKQTASFSTTTTIAVTTATTNHHLLAPARGVMIPSYFLFNISSSQVVTQSYILSSHVCHNYLFYILPLHLHLQPEYRLHDSLPSSMKEQVTGSVVICDYLKRARVSLSYALIIFSPSYSCVVGTVTDNTEIH